MNYQYTNRPISVGDTCLFIYSCSPYIIDDTFNTKEGAIIIPVRIINIDENKDGLDIILRPRIINENKWKIFVMGINTETKEYIDTIKISLKPNSPLSSRLIYYDWFSGSGAEWSNEKYLSMNLKVN